MSDASQHPRVNPFKKALWRKQWLQLGVFGMAALLHQPVAAGEFFTSFENITQTGGDFTLGASPDTVRFENSESKVVGQPSLYHTGSFSLMIDAGRIGSLTLETPATSLQLFFRDQNQTNQSSLTLFDAQGGVIAQFSGSPTWQEIRLTANEGLPIARIELQNNAGEAGIYSVIDDFGFVTAADGGARTGLADPIPASIRRLKRPVRLETIATGLTAPNSGAFAPGRDQQLFIADQIGIVWALDLITGEKTVFLDLADRLVTLGVAGPGSFDERGLLGIAFHSQFADNGLFYTYSSEPVAGPADFSTLPAGTVANHQSVIHEWRVSDPTAPGAVVDPASVRELLRIDQPQFNHNGGALHFGLDERLYIAVGDGGAADDQGVGHSPIGNGQDLSNPLGAILRIDPLGANSANGQYGVPLDNPFVGQDRVVQEIFAYGFRNPFRFSFDRQTGALYVADVGQNDVEEVNIVTAGGNYGWPFKEGAFFFDPNGEGNGFVTDQDPGNRPAGLIDPLAQYDHDEGQAIIGGTVYRGRSIPWLRGRYVFGDLAGTINSGRLFVLDRRNRINELPLVNQQSLGMSLLGFGEDADGELYVLANTTGVPFGDTGVVQRMMRAGRPRP